MLRVESEFQSQSQKTVWSIVTEFIKKCISMIQNLASIAETAQIILTLNKSNHCLSGKIMSFIFLYRHLLNFELRPSSSRSCQQTHKNAPVQRELEHTVRQENKCGGREAQIPQLLRSLSNTPKPRSIPKPIIVEGSGTSAAGASATATSVSAKTSSICS